MDRICSGQTALLILRQWQGHAKAKAMRSHYASLTEGFSNPPFRKKNLPCAPRSAPPRAALYTMPPAVCTGPPVLQRVLRKSAFARVPDLSGAHLCADYHSRESHMDLSPDFRTSAALQVLTAPCWRFQGFNGTADFNELTVLPILRKFFLSPLRQFSLLILTDN